MTRKIDTNLRKTDQTWGKNNSNKIDFSKNEIPDLYS